MRRLFLFAVCIALVSIFVSNICAMESFFKAVRLPARNDYSGVTGIQLTMNDDANVLALGRPVTTTFNQEHTITLWDVETKEEITNIIITPKSDQFDVKDGRIAYEMLESFVKLLKGKSYQLMSEEFAGGDNWATCYMVVPEIDMTSIADIDGMKKVNKKIIAHDGYELEICLWLPENENIQKLVLNINSSGPHTYINTFKWTDDNIYHYQEYFAKKFCENNIAYCTYSTRGVDLCDESPFLKIKMDEYKTYLLSNSILDIEIIIDGLKSQKELKHTQIYLFGLSEATMIAPLFALKHPGKVSGLLLAGYACFNMKDILIWQNNGGSSMVWYKRYFDKDGDGKISKEEYMKDPYNMAKTVLNNTPFEQIDANNDGVIDKEDFAIILKERLESILSAIEKKDDKWLLENYPVPLTTEWFRQYFEIESNFETLQKLNLPIAIFHGEFDQSVDVKGVYAINEKFIELGKTNLSVKVYSRLEHDIYFANIIDITQSIGPITDLVNTVKGW